MRVDDPRLIPYAACQATLHVPLLPAVRPGSDSSRSGAGEFPWQCAICSGGCSHNPQIPYRHHAHQARTHAALVFLQCSHSAAQIVQGSKTREQSTAAGQVHTHGYRQLDLKKRWYPRTTPQPPVAGSPPVHLGRPSGEPPPPAPAQSIPSRHSRRHNTADTSTKSENGFVREPLSPGRPYSGAPDSVQT